MMLIGNLLCYLAEILEWDSEWVVMEVCGEMSTSEIDKRMDARFVSKAYNTLSLLNGKTV